MKKPIIEQMDRPEQLPVAPSWLVTVVMFICAMGMSILAFNLGG